MLFRSKNKGTLRMQELFSNQSFQLSLEDLKWQHAESENHAWEFIKIKSIEKESLFFAIILRSLTTNLKFGEYVYVKRGIDLLERTSPLIKKKRKENKFFSVSKVFKQKPKPKPVEGKGVVIN